MHRHSVCVHTLQHFRIRRAWTGILQALNVVAQQTLLSQNLVQIDVIEFRVVGCLTGRQRCCCCRWMRCSTCCCHIVNGANQHCCGYEAQHTFEVYRFTVTKLIFEVSLVYLFLPHCVVNSTGLQFLYPDCSFEPSDWTLDMIACCDCNCSKLNMMRHTNCESINMSHSWNLL